MFRLVVVVVAVAAATLCPTVVAGGGAQPILKLALQRADMPATTRKAPLGSPSPHVMDQYALSPLGVRGLQGADYQYSVPAGGTVDTAIGAIDKEWLVEGEVFRVPDQSGAKRLFALGKAADIGFFSDFPGTPKNLVLPSYGDEHIGRVSTHPGTGVNVMVFVRSGAVVWGLRVSAIPRQFRATRQQLVAVLKTYAAKQKARVGAG